VVETPSLLEFYAYSLTSAGAIFGPFFEFRDFLDCMHGREHYKNIPSNVIKSYALFAESMIYGLAFAYLDNRFPLMHTVSDEFEGYNYLYKSVYIMIQFFARRC